MAAQKKSSDRCPGMTMYSKDPSIHKLAERLRKKYDAANSELLRNLLRSAGKYPCVEKCMAKEIAQERNQIE